MNTIIRVTVALALFACAGSGFAQYQYNLTLRGYNYQTNEAGNIVSTPITDKSVLQELATAGGVDSSGLALVYHVNGTSFGDTIDVINAKTGATLDMVWGFYFGSDLSLGRMALTNSAATEERRVDYIYTKQSPYALGSSFTSKRFLTDKKGQTRNTVDGQVQYLIRPENGKPAQFRTFNFTTTKAFVPTP